MGLMAAVRYSTLLGRESVGVGVGAGAVKYRIDLP